MGEYAIYGGEQIKIGTCENLYYLRADQARHVRALQGNADPVSDAAELRFRFPWPDEDRIPPGAFESYDRSVAVPGLDELPGLEIDHERVQFTAPGYVISLPCPESADGPPAGRNGFAGRFHICQQRLVGNHLVLIMKCGGCGARFRLPTMIEAEPIVKAIIAHAKHLSLRGDASGAHWWAKIAERIIAGYRGEGLP